MAVIPKSSKHACRHPASRSASGIPHWVRSLTGRQTREATHSRTCWKDESTLVLLVVHQSVHALVVFFPCKISKASLLFFFYPPAHWCRSNQASSQPPSHEAQHTHIPVDVHNNAQVSQAAGAAVGAASVGGDVVRGQTWTRCATQAGHKAFGSRSL